MTAQALVVTQSGGVTPVLNASLAGVIAATQNGASAGALYGIRHGLRGLLDDDVVPLQTISTAFLDRLSRTPGAWLGSCRFSPSPAQLEDLLDRLAAWNVRWYLCIGGNDSAEASALLARAARDRSMPLQVVNIPKTIDNDLPDMDHCPGYATAASYVAASVRCLVLDTAAMRKEEPVRVIEVKGRHSGWLAASAVACEPETSGRPILVYVPERPLTAERVIADVDAALSSTGYAIVVVSEHATGEGGWPVGKDAESYVDAFGHADSPAPGAWLKRQLEHGLKVRCRLEVLGAMQKVAVLPQCELDRREAFEAGRYAVAMALAGASDCCVTVGRRETIRYEPRFGLTNLDRVAGVERLLPDEFIAGHSPSEAFKRWIEPLVAEVKPWLDQLVDPASAFTALAAEGAG